MALAAGAPIVPVRFARGLPIDDVTDRLDFPVGYGKQDIHFGAPLLPEDLARLPLRDRKDAVFAALNTLGPGDFDAPADPDPAFAAEVEAWRARSGCSPEDAVFFATLAGASAPESDGVRRLLAAAQGGHLVVDDSPADRWLADFAESVFGTSDPSLQVRRNG